MTVAFVAALTPRERCLCPSSSPCRLGQVDGRLAVVELDISSTDILTSLEALRPLFTACSKLR